MPRTAPTFESWGLSMPPPDWWQDCQRCEACTPLLLYRRRSGAWLCRGCARAPHTPLGTRWG